ncbi:MAG: HEPN domain-containing protein [Acidobacteriota bacterium]
MSANEERLRVASEWVAKAEEDLTAAAHSLRLGGACPTSVVCFHAQQCAEKYLKAYMVFEGAGFPKTHEIEELVARIPKQARPELSPEEQALLTEYAVGPRYPGWREVSLREARRAVALARRVRRHIRSLLPREALRRKS